MGFTNLARADLCRPMPNSHGGSFESVRARKDSLEQICLAMLDVATQSIATEIGNLNEPCQAAIHKKRRFNYSLDVGPKGSTPMKTAHHLGVYARPSDCCHGAEGHSSFGPSCFHELSVVNVQSAISPAQTLVHRYSGPFLLDRNIVCRCRCAAILD